MNETMQQSRPAKSLKTWQDRFSWANAHSNYVKMQDFEIEQENRKIHAALRELNQEVSNELNKSAQKASGRTLNDPTAQQQLLEQHKKNNLKTISNLEQSLKIYASRKQLILAGQEDKMQQEKYRVREAILICRQELKDLRLEIKELEKQLVVHQSKEIPYCRELVEKLEEELRVSSTKYTNSLKRYQTTEDQLLSIKPSPPIYLNTGALDQLEKREAQQYKEYLNIVKLSEVLSHRNESDLNKFSRQYGNKVRDLEQIVAKIGQVGDKLAARDIDILESKKQIQIMKLKVQQQSESAQQPLGLRRNSHSVKALAVQHKGRLSELQEDFESRANSRGGASTQRYIKSLFPTKKKLGLSEQIVELEPIKNRVLERQNAMD